nr:YcnI family protein [Nocardia bovistercoris]
MVAVAFLTGWGTATAHVTASAPDAAPGAYSVVTLRVPTESATAGTVRLEVNLPAEQPLAVVRNATTPGWDVAQRRIALPTPIDNGHGGKVAETVTSVTFTAQPGIAVAPGEFAEFRLLLGPLPNTRELVLPTLQTYSDGTVVSWIERSTDGSVPEKPAPVVRVQAEKVNDSGHSHETAEPRLAARSESVGTDWGVRAATATALAALVLAGLALIRGTRSR